MNERSVPHQLSLALDTNVVIDWLVFDDPFMAPLRDGISSKRLIALTHQPAINELQRVLAYPQLRLDGKRQSEIFARYCSDTVMITSPPGFSLQNLLLPEKFPRCRDADDQHFLALAFHGKPYALVSRDKAVLKLRRRAARFGVKILTVPALIDLLNLPPRG